MFAFTSTGCRVDQSIIGNGPSNFRIQGEMYHLMGSIVPTGQGLSSQFAQRYIHDTDYNDSIQSRVDLMKSQDSRLSQNDMETSRQIIGLLKDSFDSNNVYAQIFKSVGERLRSNGSQKLRLSIVNNRESDPRRYNLPTANEVACILVGDGSESHLNQDVIVEMKGYGDSNQSRFKRISPLHPAYFPLAYPLIFPFGEDGYKLGIPRRSEVFSNKISRGGSNGILAALGDPRNIDFDNSEASKNGITQMEYFRYKLHYREGDGTRYMFLAKRLLQQLIVDMYATMEINRLKWIIANQKQIRAELYQGK
jgi:hypothetical protein